MFYCCLRKKNWHLPGLKYLLSFEKVSSPFRSDHQVRTCNYSSSFRVHQRPFIVLVDTRSGVVILWATVTVNEQLTLDFGIIVIRISV